MASSASTAASVVVSEETPTVCIAAIILLLCGIVQTGLDEDRDRAAFRLEDGLDHVPEVLSVGVERGRLVAHDLDVVEIVAVQRVPPSAHVPGKDREHRWQERASPDAHGCDEIEPELEVRLGRDRKRKPLRVRVRA